MKWLVVLISTPVRRLAFSLNVDHPQMSVFSCGLWFILVVWCSFGLWHSGCTLVSINKVTVCRARFVLGWVTCLGLNSRCRKPISVYNQPPRSTQPGHPSVGRHNEYQPKGGDALWRWSKGRYGSCVGGR